MKNPDFFLLTYFSEEPPPNLDTEFPGAASPNSTDLSNSNSTQPAKKYEDPQRDNGRLAKKFYCLVCGQTFPYHLSLKRHVTELHENQKLFQVGNEVMTNEQFIRSFDYTT